MNRWLKITPRTNAHTQATTQILVNKLSTSMRLVRCKHLKIVGPLSSHSQRLVPFEGFANKAYSMTIQIFFADLITAWHC